MAFEFFFGLFGLISSDSKLRHKTRLESEWRLPTALNANLFREAGFKSPTGQATSDSKRPIFSTTATLVAATTSPVSKGLFSSASSSSASSIASSGSNLTTNSMSAFIKTGGTDSSGTKLSGLSASSADLISDGQLDQEPTSTTNASRSKQMRKFYCLSVCGCLWLHVFRLIIGMLVDKSLFTLDFHFLGTHKIHFLIPTMCLAIQAAAVSTLFIRNNDETNWLVPFYSSKDYLIRSRSNFKPKIEDYTKRVNISVALALVLALVGAISLSAYLIHCVGQVDPPLSRQLQTSLNNPHQQTYATSYETLTTTLAPSANALTTSASRSSSSSTATIGLQQQAAALANASTMATDMATEGHRHELAANGGNRAESIALATLITLDVVWAIYSTYICFIVSFYFNLICSIMKARFHGISKIIEDLAESNTTKTTNQARKITTLYLEHNEACELLDESNDFWQYLIFFTYFTYIPAYCYCLYNLFFVDFEAWPSFITWVIHTHTGFIILLISFSAAGVSTEAHAPYTSLHTLSLIQLPLDVEVNIATFLHRVRGLTIGYSCYDLFAITNASMSNTAAACASYFLIVADFSRSSVFTLAQMNGSTGATPTTPTPTH